MTVPEEVAALLRRVAAGEVEIHLTPEGETWDEVFAGEVTFNLSTGDLIVAFNDCDDLDYIDAVRFRDGRAADFDDWADCDPLGFLSDEERLAVENRFKAACR